MKFLRLSLVLFILLALCPAGAAQAAEVLVVLPFDVNSNSDQGDHTPGNCICSISTATGGLCTLRAAVQEANACAGNNEIVLDNGTTYTVGSFILVDPASDLQTETIYLYTDNDEASKAIIKASGAENYPVLSVGVGTLDLTNVTIRDSEGLSVGSGASLNLNKVLMTANYRDDYDPLDMRYGGGAIKNSYGNVTIYNSQFSGNATTGCGGAILNTGNLSIDFSTFNDNTATNGGAICHVGWINSGTNEEYGMSISRSEIRGNLAPKSLTLGGGNGGGIFIAGPNRSNTQITIQTSTIMANSSNWGGGIYIGPTDTDSLGGGLTLTNSSILNNSAGNGGGMMINNTGNYGSRYETYLENSTISGNDALMHGGGIYMPSTSTLAISNCTISENIADSDGDNNGDSGGIQNFSSSKTIRLENTILASNLDASTGEQPIIIHDCRGKLDLFGYNLIGKLDTTKCVVNSDATTLRGSNASPLDPLLGALDDYGYPTETHELLPGSPAINGGDPTGCKNPQDDAILNDQRGESRPYGSACDMGAVEVQFSVKKVFLPAILR